MRNQYLDAGTTQEINTLIDRVHGDLGQLQGAVELAAVRHLLKLDLKYYTTDDPSLLQEVAHKIRIGTKQILERPTFLLEAVAKFDLKALFLPDRKRILIDSNLPDLKKRWNESHEIVHGLIPWHKDYLLGDTKETLSPGCHQQLEAEANYGAGRLLFPEKTMTVMVHASPPSIAHIKSIATHFENTITSSLWRYVEYSERPCFGIVGAHPHRSSDDAVAVEYFIRSRRFATEYSGLTEEFIFELIRGYCTYKKTGPLGSAEIILQDDRGQAHCFQAETFGNGYKVLTLATHVRPTAAAVVVPVSFETKC